MEWETTLITSHRHRFGIGFNKYAAKLRRSVRCVEINWEVTVFISMSDRFWELLKKLIGLFLGIRGDAVVERLRYGDRRVIDAVRGITGPITTTRGQPVPMALFATRCQRAIDT